MNDVISTRIFVYLVLFLVQKGEPWYYGRGSLPFDKTVVIGPIPPHIVLFEHTGELCITMLSRIK